MNAQQFSKPLDLRSVKISDAFWSAYQDRVIKNAIPYQWEALNDRIPGAEKSHCMANFRVAAGLEKGSFGGYVFQDSDFAKWIEGVGYALAIRPDPELEKLADGAIDLVVSAQQEDGYLDTYYIINGLDKRFTNLKDNHELYCFGHLLEGAIAYWQATGKDKLLKAMIRFTDCVIDHFGPEEGKLKGYTGHEVAEMALMRLYGVTGDARHLALAKYFIDQRGVSPLYFEEETARHGNDFYWKDSYFRYQYYQAGKPVREQHDAEGHSVRAVYLYSGMADVARASLDESLYQATLHLWESIVRRRMYITGSIGSSAYGESFSFDYHLPNDTVYGETCAAIGLVFFARRMLETAPKAEYADVMERTLYNGIISGMSLDGTKFFYVNPLEVVPEATEKSQNHRHVKPERQKWFGCACCPPNLVRLLTSIGSYAYTSREDTLYTHLYLGGEVETELQGRAVSLTIQSELPWQGKVRITNGKEAEYTLALRLPLWCEKPFVTLNGKEAQGEIRDGYLYLRRAWKAGDSVELRLDMPVRLMRANAHVREDAGKLAVTRGPLVYCLEEADNGPDLHLVRLSREAKFTEEYRPDLLDGVMLLKTRGEKRAADSEEALYLPAAEERFAEKDLTFIPYYAWANRSPGEMRVWIREK